MYCFACCEKKLDYTECRVPSTEYRVPSTEYRVPSTEYRVIVLPVMGVSSTF